MDVVIFTLLAQAAPAASSIASIEDEVSRHPYAVVILLTALFGLVLGLGKWGLSLVEQRINERFTHLDAANTHQDERLDQMESDLRKYESNVAVGTATITQIAQAVARTETRISEHAEREETTTWAKIDEIRDAVAEVKLENERAHGALGERITRIETKMPNGQLEELAAAYRVLAERSHALQNGGKKRKARKAAKR